MRAPLYALALTAPFLFSCDLLDSAQATVIVGGLLAATPELDLQGQFDVPAQVTASAWVGQRDSPTSTEVPQPIGDADVAVTFSGNRIGLAARSEPGLYSKTNSEDAGLMYVAGGSYTFRAALPNDRSVEYGGTLQAAPNMLTPAAIVLTPEPTPHASLPGVGDHPRSTSLTLSWPQGFGRYTYVTVFRANPTQPSTPTLVYQTRPESAQDALEFVLGTPPTEIQIPEVVFVEDGLYAIILVAMDRGSDLLPNTFLGSPVLVGSGAVRFIAVGSQ